MNHYQLLEVSENASHEEIRKAYRKKALLHHPDLHTEDRENQKEKFLQIQKAYEILINPTARALYDLQLKGKYEGPTLNEFWKYTTPPKDFTPRRKKPFKSWKQNTKEEAASWEAEKAAAKSQKMRASIKEEKTRIARQVRIGHRLRGYWQSQTSWLRASNQSLNIGLGLTWQDGALTLCCLCYFCYLWNNSKLKLIFKDS